MLTKIAGSFLTDRLIAKEKLDEKMHLIRKHKSKDEQELIDIERKRIMKGVKSKTDQIIQKEFDSRFGPKKHQRLY